MQPLYVLSSTTQLLRNFLLSPPKFFVIARILSVIKHLLTNLGMPECRDWITDP